MRKGLGKFLRDLFSGLGHGGEVVKSPRGGVPLSTAVVEPMAIATVYRCVKLLSDSVANLPVNVETLRDGVWQLSRQDTGLMRLLQIEPMPGWNAFDLLSRAVVDMLTYGNCYIVPVRSTVAPYNVIGLVRVPPMSVTHDTRADRYSVTLNSSGVSGEYGEEEMIHLKDLPGGDPKVGYPTLRAALRVIATATAGDVEAQKRFENSGLVNGVISNGAEVQGFGEYQDDYLAEVTEMVKDQMRTDGVAWLPGEVKYQQLAMTSADMQFLQLRQFVVKELCRFFGVHPSFVYEDSSSNYKSAEMANVAFLSNTLDPLLRKIEGELTRKLISPEEWGMKRIRFDRSELYACDLATKARYESTLMGLGRSVNEMRRLGGLPPVEGGDKVLVSANLKSLEDGSIV